jgi:predicted acylesterase/phospholipase RssA
MSALRDSHLFGPGPKRILALDGGGVRGIVSLAYLERLETLLRERTGRRLPLGAYFDLIGGTSTGALIATGLALGKEVSSLIDTYLSLARHVFRGAKWHRGLLTPKFRTEHLMEQIRANVGGETLGSERLMTGLAIVAKRIDTGSVWLFHNNPRGRYFDAAGDADGAVPNRDLPLAQLLRASTAAPTFFAPENIDVARGVRGVFVDGGVSPHGNPALLTLMLATLRGYGFNWTMGADQLMLVSVGTGERPLSPARMPSPAAPAATLAVFALRSVIQDSSSLNQMLLQWMGISPMPMRIDAEIGDLAEDQLGPAPLLRYLRYDMLMSRDWMRRETGASLTEEDIAALDRIDDSANVPRLLELARAAAARQVRIEHLPASFDPVPG